MLPLIIPKAKSLPGQVLIEVAMAMVVITLMALGVAAVSREAQRTAMAQAAVQSMEALLQEAKVFRWNNGRWPTLAELNLPPSGRATPWGRPLVLENPTDRSITVRTTMPAGVLATVTSAPRAVVETDGTVRITATLTGGGCQDLAYEKKRVYLE